MAAEAKELDGSVAGAIDCCFCPATERLKVDEDDGGAVIFSDENNETGSETVTSAAFAFVN